MKVEVISSLAQQLQSLIILPDEVVIKEGCVGNSMYFIRRGLVRVIKGYGGPREYFIGGLGTGCFFGEVALVSSSKDVRRGASVVAATVLSLRRLTPTPTPTRPRPRLLTSTPTPAPPNPTPTLHPQP